VKLNRSQAHISTIILDSSLQTEKIIRTEEGIFTAAQKYEAKWENGDIHSVSVSVISFIVGF
jgi:hypothetical protein